MPVILQSATSVNIFLETIEKICENKNIKLKESHKTILSILIPALIYKDGKIIILAETIHQINRAIRKANNDDSNKFNFTNVLLGYNCITNIDKYGAITIPLCVLLNKLTIKREIIGGADQYLNKKVLTNATLTLCISEALSHIGIPKSLSIIIVNIVLEWALSNIDNEYKAMLISNTAFKNKKMSELKTVLKQMQFEKVFVSTALLLVITNIGLSISSSLILTNVINEMIQLITVRHKTKNVKGFLN